MAAITKPATIACFPERQVIIDYFTTHPGRECLDAKAMVSIAPDGINKVADFFANKRIPSDKVTENVKYVLTDHEEMEKLRDLETRLSKLFVSIDTKRQDASKPSPFENSMKHIHSEVQQATKQDGGVFSIALAIYDGILNDLLDNATFTPPAPGEKSWTKHVADVTRRVKES